MKYQDFKEIYLSIADYENEKSFITELGATYRLFDYDYTRIVEILQKIYILKDKKFKSILAATGLTQAKFSRSYSISLKTIESWVAETRTPPEYVYLMLAYAAFNDTKII